MTKHGWVRIDRFMRSMHLYTGVFLVPWMAVYATSALCLNHHHWFTEHFDITPPKWEHVREVEFTPDEAFPNVPADQAKAILQHLDLDGPHHVPGRQPPQKMVIMRVCGSGNYRVTWNRDEGSVLVEQQRPFSAFRLVNFLHFRGGYGQPYAAAIIWAVIVDAVAISIWFWIVSGIYIWARRPNKRLLGGTCLIGGTLLFVILVAWWCA